MSRKVEKERRCLLDCVKSSRQCAEGTKEDKKEVKECKIDYAECLDACNIKHL